MASRLRRNSRFIFWFSFRRSRVRVGSRAGRDELISDVLKNIGDYVGRTQAPITPADIGEEIMTFWEAARIPKGTRQSELESQLDELKFQRKIFEKMASDEINLG